MAHIFLQTTITFFFFLFLLLVVLYPSPTAANKPREVVLDIEGNPLEAGSNYYIKPLSNYTVGGGGIKLHSKQDTPPCPSYIGQASNKSDLGDPVKFILPFSPDQKHIYMYDTIHIESTTTPKVCSDQVWMVVRVLIEPKKIRHDLKTGGCVDESWDEDCRFTIQKAVNGTTGYMIWSTPALGWGYLSSYRDINDGKIYLEISRNDTPLRVAFVKASGKEFEVAYEYEIQQLLTTS